MRRLRARVALLLLAAGVATCPAPALLAQAPVPPAADTLPPEAGRRWERTPLVGEAILLGKGVAHAGTAPLRWGRRDLARAGAGIGAVALVSLLDEAGRDLMADEAVRGGTADRLEEWVKPFGRERALQALGAFLVAGVALDDERMRAVAAEGGAAALVAAGIVQPALAEALGRPRPRRNRPAHTFDPFSGNISFPSGHTTAAFSVAAVVATEYPHPAARVAAYGIASAVGVSRMYAGAHFLSDVVAAALLGTVTGQAVARYGVRERARLAPVVQGEELFLVVSVPW